MILCCKCLARRNSLGGEEASNSASGMIQLVSIKHIKCYQRSSSEFTYTIIIIQLKIQFVIRTEFLLCLKDMSFPNLKKKKAFHLHIAEFALKCLFPVVSFFIPSFYISLCLPGIKALPCLDLYIVCASSISYSRSLVGQKSR